MKKNKLIILLFIFILILLIVFYLFINNKDLDNKKDTNKNKISKNIYVSYNGELKVNNNNLVNQYNEIIRLKGISSHGIQWYGDFLNESMIKSLKDKLNINLLRISMYTEENGYISNPSLKDKLIKACDIAIKNDLYVIIDWHILSDNNPNKYINESEKFFDEISKRYKNKPNVIYEICNEPNGNTTWDDIRNYANKIIPIIRNNSKNSLIIVGTPNYSQDVDVASNNKLDYDNIAYALHFYAGTHKDELREKIIKARNNNICVFVSEFGLSDASGNNGVYINEANKWIKFLKENNISIVNWSLSDKNESSALLKSGASKYKINDDELSESGKYIKEIYKNY